MSLTRVIDDILKAEAAKRRALATLHTELGYPSGRALAEAILEATEGGAPRGQGSSKWPKSKGRGLHPEHKQAITDALQRGMNGTRVAREFGVSYPTVHEIKKSLGLVKARGKAAGSKKRKA